MTLLFQIYSRHKTARLLFKSINDQVATAEVANKRYAEKKMFKYFSKTQKSLILKYIFQANSITANFK